MLKILLIALASGAVVVLLVNIIIRKIIKKADQIEQLKEQAQEVEKLKFYANKVNNRY